MATLENIRKRGKLLAIVIGLALGSFILGDMIRSGKSIFGGQKYDVVSVNSNHVNIQEYEKLVSETEEYVQISQGVSTLDAQTSQKIRSSVWDMTIRENLLNETYEDLGLSISKEELSDLVIGNHVHPLVAQTFVNQQTGQFDKQLVINLIQGIDRTPQNQQEAQQIAQMKTIWLYIEDYIKDDRRYNKYMSLVSKGLYVTNLEVEEDNYERSYTVDIDIVGKTVTQLNDTSITASEAEIKAYYDEHKNMFKNTVEGRDISYITFDVYPSSADTLTALEKAERFKTELAESDDEQNIVNLKSSSPQPVRYYSYDEFKNSQLDSSFFENDKGYLYGPYMEYGAYNVVKIVDKVESRPDTVSARHILISPQNPKIGSMVRANQVADSIINVLNNGGDFAALAALYSDDPGSAKKGGLYEDFVEGSMVTEFNDYCFENNIGVVGKVETTYGVHIIEVTERKNLIPKTKLAFIRVDIPASQQTYDDVYSEAMRIRGIAKDEEGFDKVIEENKYLRKEATDITQGTYTIAGLENVKDIVNWSFKAERGEVSNVFELPDKYVIALLKNKNEIGFLALDKVRSQVENSVIQKKKVEKIYNESFEGKTVTDLDAFAGKIGVQKMSIPKVAFNAFQLATIGYEPALLGAMKKFEQGKVYGPIKGLNGVYFVKATSVTEAVALTAEEISAQKGKMKSTMQQRANYQAFVALKDAAKIVDRRATFY